MTASCARCLVRPWTRPWASPSVSLLKPLTSRPTSPSQWLPLEAPARTPPPAAVAGVPVRSAAVSLGIVVFNPAPPPPRRQSDRVTRAQSRPAPATHDAPAPDLLDAVTRDKVAAALACQARVARLHLSDIGRCMAASTYVLSPVLYHAEFNGLPRALLDLAAAIAREVAPGVPADLLCGPPSQGGFGLLPFAAHVHARHAAMACRLVHRLLQPVDTWQSWVHFASFLLGRACPGLHPAQSLLAATYASADQARVGDLGLPPGTQAVCLPPGILTDMVVALQRVGPLQPLLLDMDPAPVLLSTPAHTRDDLTHALTHLAWRVPQLDLPPPQQPQPLVPAAAPVPVRALTAIINAPAAARRAWLHDQFVAMAFGVPAATPADSAAFRTALAAIWRMPFPNHLKCPLWRLAIDAIPGSRIPAWRCPCDLHRVHLAPARLHSFWDCPVAHGVRAQLQRALGMDMLPRHAVWLAQPPRPDIHVAVWRLVACMAIDAMEFGRRLLWARRHDQDWPDPGPAGVRALHDGLPAHVVDHHVLPAVAASRDDAVRAVANQAAARFWRSVYDFAAAHRRVAAPPRFQTVPPVHPFIALRAGALEAQLPVDIDQLLQAGGVV